MKRILIAVLTLVAFGTSAEAKLHPRCNIDWPCIAPSASTPEQARVTRGRWIARSFGIGTAIEKPIRKMRVSARHPASIAVPIPKPRPHIETQVVSHPEGCPRRLFCGCGAAVRIFGKPVRELWLAANWFRYPRSAPAPGMVAVRRHHVFVLEEDLGQGRWLAYDANSGGHATRVHARSIAGYTIVNPHGAG